jgi:hypothetical protein
VTDSAGPASAETASAPDTMTQGEGPLKEASLSAQLPEAPSDDRDVADLYDERLRGIARIALGRALDLTTDADNSTWEIIRASVLDAGFLEDRRRAEMARLSEPRASQEAIPGDAATVNLTVGTITRQLSPGQRRQFVRGQLSRTVARLEQEGATREEITDIVFRALRPEIGTVEVSAVARRLLGYLTGQTHRDVDYYLSAGMCADLLARDENPQARFPATAGYSYVVQGMWRLARDEPADFSGRRRRVASDNLANLATQVMAFGERGQGEPDGRVALVSHDLVRLSAVTAEASPLERQVAKADLAELGFHDVEPVDAAAVLNALGGRARSWNPNPSIQAVLESAGAVSSILCGTPESVTPRLFNAGVSVLRVPGGRSAEGARARLILNGVGLLWGVSLRDTLADIDTAMFSSAVNYVGAASDLHEMVGDSAVWSSLVGAVTAVAGLSELTSAVEHHARLIQSSERLNLGALRAPERAELVATLVRGLQALTAEDERIGAMWTAYLSGTELARVTAAVIGWTNRTLLDLPVSSVAADVADVVADRPHARSVFVEGFGRYGSPPPTHPGIGPLVAAGVMDQETWIRDTEELFTDPGTMVPTLERF